MSTEGLLMSTPRVIRLAPSFMEIVAAESREAYYLAHGIDLCRPYTESLGDGFALVAQQTSRDADAGTPDEVEAAAIDTLKRLIRQRQDEGHPVLKGVAEVFLQAQGLTRAQARALINARNGKEWRLLPLPAGRGRGTPLALYSAESAAK
jgi:hypothetical protein